MLLQLPAELLRLVLWELDASSACRLESALHPRSPLQVLCSQTLRARASQMLLGGLPRAPAIQGSVALRLAEEALEWLRIARTRASDARHCLV